MHEQIRWIPVPPTMPGFWARIRSDLVHGYHPSKADLRELWYTVTGERIHDGRRCGTCDGGGLVSVTRYVPPFPEPVSSKPCPSCDGTGWWARPTSMMQEEQR